MLKLEDVIKARAKEKELERKTTNPKSDESPLPTINTNDELAKLAGVGHNINNMFCRIFMFCGELWEGKGEFCYMSINWDAVGAIGQWFGGVITAVGIYAAIKTFKPKIMLDVLFVADQSGGTIKVSAINKRASPLSIVRLNIRDIKYRKSLISSTVTNVYVEPMNITEVTNSLRWQFFKDKRVNSIKDICKLISVIDNLGNEHFVYTNLFAKIERLIFMRIFGKKM